MNNREIHEHATSAYARFTGKRTGWSVRWETGTYRRNQVEHDCAGFMSKRDAMRLGAILVADGRAGVRVYATHNIDRANASFSDDPIVLSVDSPEVQIVASVAR